MTLCPFTCWLRTTLRRTMSRNNVICSNTMTVTQHEQKVIITKCTKTNIITFLSTQFLFLLLNTKFIVNKIINYIFDSLSLICFIHSLRLFSLPCVHAHLPEILVLEYSFVYINVLDVNLHVTSNYSSLAEPDRIRSGSALL